MSVFAQPDHPAARNVVDEAGRVLTLGLSEAEIRLECVKIAVQHPQCFAGHAIGAAKDLASFVMTGELPWAEQSESDPTKQAKPRQLPDAFAPLVRPRRASWFP